jgi:hypothetical protein
MYSHYAVLRIVWAAAAAVVLFLVVHTAMEAFSHATTVLTGV